MKDAKSITSWESWIFENNEHIEEVNRAREIILPVGIKDENVPGNRINF